jgi:hypothetical protein
LFALATVPAGPDEAWRTATYKFYELRDKLTARARVATAEEKPELWRTMTATGTPYDEFQAKTDREIPVVVLEPG